MDSSIQNHVLPAIDRGLAVVDRYLDVIVLMGGQRVDTETPLLAECLAAGSPTLFEHLTAAVDTANEGLSAMLGFDATIPVAEGRGEAIIRAGVAATRANVAHAAKQSLLETAELQDYVIQTMLPEFYFHITHAHGILRGAGAHIGKRDYLGNLEEHYVPAPS
jgi:uncharacterized protein